MFTQMSPAMQGFFCHLLNKECILLTWHYSFSTDNYYPDILYALIMYSFVICLIIHCMSKWKLDSKVGEHCFSIYFVQSSIFYLFLQYYLAHEGSNYWYSMPTNVYEMRRTMATLCFLQNLFQKQCLAIKQGFHSKHGQRFIWQLLRFSGRIVYSQALSVLYLLL